MDNDSGDDETENSIEKSEKKNDQDQVDGMKQEVYSKGKEMHNDISYIQFGYSTQSTSTNQYFRVAVSVFH